MPVQDEVIINTEVIDAKKSIDQLEDLAEATGDASEAAEDYTGALKDSASEVEVMGVSLNGLKGAFNNSIGVVKNAIKSFGGLKTAMLALPIFALIAAVTGLVSWLTKTQKGIDFVSKAMKVLDEILAEVTTRAISFAKALGSLFTLDWEGFKKNSSDAFTGMADSMKEAYNAGILLAAQLKALEEGTALNNIAIARYRSEIEAQKLISEDVTQDINVRIKAQKEAQALTEKILNLQTKSLEREEEIFIAEAQKYLQRNQGETLSTELIQKSADLQVRQLEFEEEANARRVEQQNALNGLYAEANAQRVEDTVQLTAVEVAAIDIKTDKEVQAAAQLGQLEEQSKQTTLKNLKEITDATQNSIDEQVEAREAQAATERALFEGTYANIIELLGAESVAGKAAAIAQATINTYEAVTIALTAKTLAGRILGVTYALTTGLAAVKQIVGTPVPKVEVVSTPFADGGMIYGKSHKYGGVHIEAEGGEAIINKRSMAIPWVREQASRLNQIGGGVKFARGGVVPTPESLAFANIEAAVRAVRPVLVTEDLNRVQGATVVTNEISTL